MTPPSLPCASRRRSVSTCSPTASSATKASSYRDKLFVYGCVDPGNTPVPSLNSVKRKIARALEHLDPTRVLLAPDCGLMTISRALARDKLKVMVEAARALRG